VNRDSLDFHGSKRFEVLARLGAGAAGVVYSATDREAGGRVALKVLKSLSPESIADFKREFRAISDLEHPNLVRLGELIAEGNRWLFTMELVEGVDFLQYVRPEGVVDESRLRSAVSQLVLALDALHGNGQVHRDVKPSNVLVRDDGSVKLLDFGLVTTAVDLLGPKTPDEPAVGTTAYVAPEQAAGRAVSPAADLYAVGVMLYEALTASLPFDGPPLKILMDKQTQRVRPPSQLAEHISPDIEQLTLELLSAEPLQRPSASRVLSRLRGKNQRHEGVSQPTRSHAFFGRKRELEQLARALSKRGTGASLSLVIGAPGVGRSSLLARLARRLTSNGVLVLSGRCRAAESVPYRALDGLLEELAQHLSRLTPEIMTVLLPEGAGLLGRTFPALARVDAIARAPLDKEPIANPLEQRRRAFGALRALLARLAKRQPLVLAIDDIQWADKDSLSVLRTLFTSSDAPQIALLATLSQRPRESQAPGQLSAEDLKTALPVPFDVIELGGLDDAAAIELTQHLMDLDPPPNPPPCGQIAEEAQGHPRMIEELVHHLKTHALSPERISIEEVVRVRTESLDPAALHLVALLAMSAAPIAQEVLRHAAGLTAQELSTELTRLRLSRLIRVVGVRGKERIEVYHDRIREAVLAQLPPDQQALHHRALALAHEAVRSQDYEAMSRHWRAASAPDRAADYSARAADEALLALAFDRAALLYRDAVELSGSSVDASLHERHGDALVSAGRGPEGARAYLAAAAGKSGVEAIDLRRRAAEQLMVCGHAAEGLAAARDVVQALNLSLSESPTLARWKALGRLAVLEVRGLGYRERDTSEIAALDLMRIDTCWSMFVGFAALEPTRVADPLTLQLKLALKAGEPYRVGRGLSALSTMTGMLRGGAPTRAQDLAERAEAIAQRHPNAHLLGLCQMNTGLRAFHAGDLESARTAFQQAERTLQENCRGATWELGTTHFFSLLCHLAAGDIATLIRLASDWYEDAVGRGDLHAATNVRARVLPAVALLSGKPELARAHATPPIENAGMPVLKIQEYWRTVSLCECDLFERKAEVAHARLAELFKLLKQAHLLNVRSIHFEAHWLRARILIACLASGNTTIKPTEVLRDASIVEGTDLGGAQGISLSLRAGLAELTGDPNTVEPAWRGAEAQLRTDGRALLAQLARLRRGRLGALPDAARAEREARVWLSGAGVEQPDRLLNVYLPGRHFTA